jgi:hypothetical protein
MIRKLLAVAAIAAAALAVPATAAFASPPGNTPQSQQPWQQQDKNMCPGSDNGQWGSSNGGNWNKNDDGNCGCQQQWGQNRDVFPFRSQCGQCHEVTTWVESWTWTWRHHHVFRVPVWHRVVTERCDQLPPPPPVKCIPQHVDIMFNSEGGTTTNDVVHVGEVLVNATFHLTEKVTATTPKLVISPPTGIENTVLDFTVAGSCARV